MLGRRRNFRHGVANAPGTLRVLRDVTIARTAEREFVAISTEPAINGERLTLEHTVNGATVAETVRVVDTRPALVRGAVRHRLTLTGIDQATSTGSGQVGSASDSKGRSMIYGFDHPAGEQLAALTRELQVRLLNCSGAACLVETNQPVSVGTVAVLQISFGGLEYDDAVQV